METWDTDYEDAIKVCRQKIEKECKYYLGIFGYRYGWAPQMLKEEFGIETVSDLGVNRLFDVARAIVMLAESEG